METDLARCIAELRGADFLSPWVLVALLPLAAGGAIFLGRRELRLALRTVALGFAVVALADPVSRRVTSHSDLVALFDVSRSVSARGREALLTALEPFLRKPSTLHLVAFAKDSSHTQIPLPTGLSAIETSLEQAVAQVDTGATDLEQAIQFAAQRFPRAPLLLLSDGHETAGNARRAAREASPIFPLVPNQGAFLAPRLLLSSLQAPLVVNEGDALEILASLRNGSPSEASGTLEIFLEDEKLLSRQIAVPAREERLFTLKALPGSRGGLKRIRATLREESTGQQSEIARWVTMKSRARILFLSGTKADERVLGQLFSLKGYSVQNITAEGNEPIPTSFEENSAVILNNIPADRLPGGFLDALKGYVARGGGLVIIGGDRSFGLGRYIGTPLEDLSPVKFVPPQTTKREVNAAVIFLIDKSRSMAAEGKIESAREAALVGIRAMRERDFAGVIGFDSSPFVVIPIGPVAEVREVAARRLFNLTAAGRTELLNALTVARQNLEKTPASRKHIILLSDGKVPDEGALYDEEVRRGQAQGITLSSVAVGAEADVPFLKALSITGRGAFYQTLDPTNLPEIFLQDVQVTTGEKTLKEQSIFNVRIGPDGLRSTDGEDFPPLRGFVQTLPKREARLELIVTDREGPHPLLASAPFEKGTVIAFTSDANGRWSLPWLSWKPFAKFWTGIVEGVEHQPGSERGRVDFDLRHTVSRGSLKLDLAIFDDRLRREPAPPIGAEVLLPHGVVSRVMFSETEKGRFTASIEEARPGDYRVTIDYGTMKFPQLGINLSGDLFGEIAGQGIEAENLSEIARLTGGSVNPDELTTPELRTEQLRHLALPLIVAAFLLLLIEAATRYLAFRVTLRRRKIGVVEVG